MAVGRISGPLLKDNLLRNGVNLAFETSLLYLDVVNSRVGINTASPQYDLDVNGTTRSQNLYTTTQAQLATFTISGNTIASSSNTINLTPNGANPTVYSGTINVGNLALNGNTFSSTNTNGNINITANGTGAVNLNSNVLINGSLHATGNITADGNIQLGAATNDTITFTGEVNSNILPSVTQTYDLGSNSLQWNNVWAQTVNATNLNITNFTATSVTTSGTPSLTISGNTITASGTNADINFSTPGTGGILLGNFKFYQNTITNTVSNSVTQISETGSGYVKINGTFGLVIPSGSSVTRPALAYTETGMIRFNTDQQYVEVYNGTAWTSVAGASSGISQSQASDIALGIVISLG